MKTLLFMLLIISVVPLSACSLPVNDTCSSSVSDGEVNPNLIGLPNFFKQQFLKPA